MEDHEVLGGVNELVNEDQKLYHRAGRGGLSAREHERLCQLEVNLDRGWNLLGQCRVLREAGCDDPDEPKVRVEKREDRRGLPAVTPQAGCGALGSSLA